MNMRTCLTNRLILAIIALAGLTPAATAEEIPGQVVTYADFSRIVYVASSMSRAYYATTEGVIVYNKLENRWDEPLTGTLGVDHNDIDRVWVDRFDEKLFIRTGVGLYEFDRLFEKWYPTTELPALENSSHHVSPPEMMFAPVGFLYYPEGSLADNYGRNFTFSDILDDGSGELWIGTWGTGPAMARKGTNSIELIPCGLIQNRVNAVFDDNGLLWVGGAITDPYRTGITIFDPDELEFDYIESGLERDFPVVDVNCLTGNEDYILIGTSDGLLFLDRYTERVSDRITTRLGLIDNNVLCLEMVGDSVFVGTAYGLSLLTSVDDELQMVRPKEFFNKIIYDLELVDSSLWIATNSGAYRLKLATGQLQLFQDPEQFLFSDVYDIEAYSNSLWLAGNEGALRVDLTTAETTPYSIFSTYYTPRALAVNGEIAVIAADRGITVISYLYDPPRTRNFTTDDGLPSNYVFSLEMDDDYIWIGSEKGLTRFWWNNPNRVD